MYSLAGRTPRKTSLANMYGRRYRLDSGWPGTQSASAPTSADSEARNASSGSVGIDMRAADRLKRRGVGAGREKVTPPPGAPDALGPSKISWADGRPGG